MLLFQGTNRVFDKPTTEDSTSTSTARILTLYGVTDYSQILNCIIPIMSTVAGQSGATTININSLGVKSLKIYKNGNKLNPTNVWTNPGQLYYVVYDGSDVVIFGGNSDNASTDSPFFDVPDTILDLTSTSTASDITNAFGNESVITGFINAIQNLKLVRFIENNNLKLRLSTSQNSIIGTTTTQEIVQVLMADLSLVRRLVFTRDTTVTNAYKSVLVQDIPLGGTEFFDVSRNVLLLSSGARASDIVTAFGGADKQTAFIDAILHDKRIRFIIPEASLIDGTNEFYDSISIGQLFNSSTVQLFAVDSEHHTLQHLTLTFGNRYTNFQSVTNNGLTLP